MKRKLLFAVTCFGTLTASAQNFEWANHFEGTGDDYVEQIITDASGNIYATGYINGTVDFDPTTGVLNATAQGSYDGFISKMDANGALVWAKTFGGNQQVFPIDLAFDNSGNILVVGGFYGTADFDPSATTVNVTSSGNKDYFISKFDANGNFLSVLTAGGTSNVQINEIEIDALGSIYLAGNFDGSSVDLDPGAGTTNFNSAGSNDIFLFKLDASGTYLWGNTFGDTDNDYVLSLAIDNNNKPILSGQFFGTIDIDPSVSSVNLISSGTNDNFVAKFDSNGSLFWANRMGDTDHLAIWGTKTNSNDDVYLIGNFQGTQDFDGTSGIASLTANGTADIFITKLDMNGNHTWTKQFGSTNWNLGRGFDVDANDNLYFTGYFSGTIDFDAGTGIANLTAGAGSDIFICKYTSAGDFAWAETILSSNYGSGTEICVTPAGKIVTSGYFDGVTDFDFGTGTNNITSLGSQDFYFHQMNQDILSLIENSNENGISIYPNPSSSNIKIQGDIVIENIIIFNLNGELVQSETNSEFSINELPTGVYTIQVQSSTGTAVSRFVKQ